MTSIDLSRVEQRFLVSFGEERRLAEDIADVLLYTAYSNRPFSQTVYINDDEFSVPWGVSLKARRYIRQPQQRIRLHHRTLFSCEIKTEESEGSQRRLKQKKVMTLKDFCFWAGTELAFTLVGATLRPHIVTQYYRRHYVSQDEALRLTLDTEMQYGFFPPNQAFLWIGDEKGARVEIKVNEEAAQSLEYRRILKILSDHGAFPVISKKDQAYNLHGYHLDQFGCHPEKELAETEIEAKFEIRHPDPRELFRKIKLGFLRGEFPDFYLAPYPYTKAGSSLNYYWSRSTGGRVIDGVKLLYKGQSFRIVTKESTEVLPDSHGLGCILKRREEKGERFVHSLETLSRLLTGFSKKYGQLEEQGYLQRSRIGFWPESQTTGRIYHLTVDRCVRDGRILYQLEIEYVGRRPGNYQASLSSEKEIIRELTELAWMVYQFSNREKQVIFPSQLTKFGWLVGGQGA